MPEQGSRAGSWILPRNNTHTQQQTLINTDLRYWFLLLFNNRKKCQSKGAKQVTMAYFGAWGNF